MKKYLSVNKNAAVALIMSVIMLLTFLCSAQSVHAANFEKRKSSLGSGWKKVTRTYNYKQMSKIIKKWKSNADITSELFDKGMDFVPIGDLPKEMVKIGFDECVVKMSKKSWDKLLKEFKKSGKPYIRWSCYVRTRKPYKADRYAFYRFVESKKQPVK